MSGNFSNDESNENNNNSSSTYEWLLTLEPTKENNLYEIYNDDQCSYSSKKDANKTVVVFKNGTKSLLKNADFYNNTDLPEGATCYIYKTPDEVAAEQKKVREAEQARIDKLMKTPNRLFKDDFVFLVSKKIINPEEYKGKNETRLEVEGYKPGFNQTDRYYIKKNSGGSRKRHRKTRRSTKHRKTKRR